jgi:dTMP kinase
MRPGVFVSFEGSEGCGKSTQIQEIRSLLEARGRSCLATREPGGTALGEVIRNLLKHAPEGRGMCPEAELLLFAASRAQLVREIIRPALDAGTWVLADRFHDSSLVYQGMARGLGLEPVRRINGFALGACRPDVTFLLDMDAAAAWERARAVTRKMGREDRMESEPAAFYETVRQGYLTLAAEDPERVVVVPAARPLEVIRDEIWQTLTRRFDGLSG